MLEFGLLGGAALCAGAVAGLAFGSTRRRVVAVALLGLPVAVGLVLWVYLASPSPLDRYVGCSACDVFVGRWWEPRFVGIVALLNGAAWAAGALFGAALRRALAGMRRA